MVTVYEPDAIPEDPNTIHDSDNEIIKLIKELLNTYPFIKHSIFIPSFVRAFVLVSSKMEAIFSSTTGSLKRVRLLFE